MDSEKLKELLGKIVDAFSKIDDQLKEIDKILIDNELKKQQLFTEPKPQYPPIGTNKFPNVEPKSLETLINDVKKLIEGLKK